jgi:glycerate 2-kinase
MESSGKIAVQIFHAAVNEADPHAAVKRRCGDIRSLYRDGGFERLLVIGFGKAAPAMASALEESLGDIIDAGIIVTTYGHGAVPGPGRIRIYEAGHPIPDENGLKASQQIVDLVEQADERALVATLISGGGSSLFVSPCGGVSLAEKQMTTNLLLKTGADIHELNTVRKHLSRVKGGRLAEIIYPATVVSLILSDVIGDRLDVIASGPTAPDPTTFSDALAVLAKYGLVRKVPEPVAALLAGGQMEIVPETPKPGDPVFRKVTNMIIGNNRMALDAARKKAGEIGIRAEVLSAEISGEAREVGKWLAHKALVVKRTMGMQPHLCLISGGETTVTVTGTGKGGRNMELALSFAMEIEGVTGITLLSAGTDGTDGPTDAAGAVVNGKTVTEAREKGINPGVYLDNNDSYNFFKGIEGLFVTGPTGTNVMDIQLVLIETDDPETA